MTKEERIAAERERLGALFADLDENQQQTAAGLISSAAFLRVTLEDLEAEINAAGCTEEYINGRDQSGVKVSAACQAYAQLNTKYQSTMQKLLKIVPPAPKKPKQKSAEQIAAEKAEAEARERRERWEKAERAKNDIFFAAVKRGELTQDQYHEYSLHRIVDGEISLPGFNPSTFGLI